MIISCAAEFESGNTILLWNLHEEETKVVVTDKEKIIVLGFRDLSVSGQGVESDYATVHSVWGLKRWGESHHYQQQPGTVSTDFSISDKL